MASENVGAVKIDGYLEKKGKLKVVTTWKKYWFVLEGRLLLYYRSQEEYLNLSPCRGSINMGLVLHIQPGLATAGVFQIITRTNTVTLRAKERAIQEKWLQALLDATGQQSVTSPVRMSHFRYSMDDLTPTSGKKILMRQNTLPNRFKNKVHRHSSILSRIRKIGGHTYTGSLDAVNRSAEEKVQYEDLTEELYEKLVMNNKEESETDSEKEVTLKNELYAVPHKPVDTNMIIKLNEKLSDIMVENSQYAVSENNKDKESNNIDVDHNKNCYALVENDQYIKAGNITSKTENNSEVEYECTYEEVQPTVTAQYQVVEPDLPPRQKDQCNTSPNVYESVPNIEVAPKETRLQKFARKFKSIKNNDNSSKKKSFGFIQRVIRKKKSSEPVEADPIYDSVDYGEFAKPEPLSASAISDNQVALIKTLTELQQKLEEKKSHIQDMLKITPATSPKTQRSLENGSHSTHGTEKTIADEYPPGLPPRRGSKTRSTSPFHDIPKNNSPIKQQAQESANQTNYSIDKILEDLNKLETKEIDTNLTPKEELTVKQLIQKFNHIPEDGHVDTVSADVSLRPKVSNNDNLVDSENIILANRHSDELNKLLEELTKVTSAPLLTPGATSSLVQMKSDGMTDEEWLAFTPIRRRRHSEPDYDVPRPHRSLQILPRSPDKKDDENDVVISATRFFGPILPPTTDINDKTPTEYSMTWRSMTPDSLEPLLHQAAIKHHRNQEINGNCDIEKDRSVGYENMNNNAVEKVSNCDKILIKEALRKRNSNFDDINEHHIETSTELKKTEKYKTNDNYLDSLEPFVEVSTIF